MGNSRHTQGGMNLIGFQGHWSRMLEEKNGKKDLGRLQQLYSWDKEFGFYSVLGRTPQKDFEQRN